LVSDIKGGAQTEGVERIFEPKRDEMTGSWRKLHNEELHNLNSLPNIIRTIKSRWIIWAGYVAQMGRRGMHIGHWWECQKERDHEVDEDVGGWTILKWILKRKDGMGWIGSIWLRIETGGGLL
jgi:hypothetical protein